MSGNSTELLTIATASGAGAGTSVPALASETTTASGDGAGASVPAQASETTDLNAFLANHGFSKEMTTRQLLQHFSKLVNETLPVSPPMDIFGDKKDSDSPPEEDGKKGSSSARVQELRERNVERLERARLTQVVPIIRKAMTDFSAFLQDPSSLNPVGSIGCYPIPVLYAMMKIVRQSLEDAHEDDATHSSVEERAKKISHLLQAATDILCSAKLCSDEPEIFDFPVVQNIDVAYEGIRKMFQINVSDQRSTEYEQELHELSKSMLEVSGKSPLHLLVQEYPNLVGNGCMWGRVKGNSLQNKDPSILDLKLSSHQMVSLLQTAIACLSVEKSLFHLNASTTASGKTFLVKIITLLLQELRKEGNHSLVPLFSSGVENVTDALVTDVIRDIGEMVVRAKNVKLSIVMKGANPKLKWIEKVKGRHGQQEVTCSLQECNERLAKMPLQAAFLKIMQLNGGVPVLITSDMKTVPFLLRIKRCPFLSILDEFTAGAHEGAKGEVARYVAQIYQESTAMILFSATAGEPKHYRTMWHTFMNRRRSFEETTPTQEDSLVAPLPSSSSSSNAPVHNLDGLTPDEMIAFKVQIGQLNAIRTSRGYSYPKDSFFAKMRLPSRMMYVRDVLARSQRALFSSEDGSAVLPLFGPDGQSILAERLANGSITSAELMNVTGHTSSIIQYLEEYFRCHPALRPLLLEGEIGSVTSVEYNGSSDDAILSKRHVIRGALDAIEPHIATKHLSPEDRLHLATQLEMIDANRGMDLGHRCYDTLCTRLRDAASTTQGVDVEVALIGDNLVKSDVIYMMLRRFVKDFLDDTDSKAIKTLRKKILQYAPEDERLGKILDELALLGPLLEEARTLQKHTIPDIKRVNEFRNKWVAKRDHVVLQSLHRQISDMPEDNARNTALSVCDVAICVASGISPSEECTRKISKAELTKLFHKALPLLQLESVTCILRDALSADSSSKGSLLMSPEDNAEAEEYQKRVKSYEALATAVEALATAVSKKSTKDVVKAKDVVTECKEDVKKRVESVLSAINHRPNYRRARFLARSILMDTDSVLNTIQKLGFDAILRLTCALWDAISKSPLLYKLMLEYRGAIPENGVPHTLMELISKPIDPSEGLSLTVLGSKDMDRLISIVGSGKGFPEDSRRIAIAYAMAREKMLNCASVAQKIASLSADRVREADELRDSCRVGRMNPVLPISRRLRLGAPTDACQFALEYDVPLWVMMLLYNGIAVFRPDANPYETREIYRRINANLIYRVFVLDRNVNGINIQCGTQNVLSRKIPNKNFLDQIVGRVSRGIDYRKIVSAKGTIVIHPEEGMKIFGPPDSTEVQSVKYIINVLCNLGVSLAHKSCMISNLGIDETSEHWLDYRHYSPAPVDMSLLRTFETSLINRVEDTDWKLGVMWALFDEAHMNYLGAVQVYNNFIRSRHYNEELAQKVVHADRMRENTYRALCNMLLRLGISSSHDVAKKVNASFRTHVKEQCGHRVQEEHLICLRRRPTNL